MAKGKIELDIEETGNGLPDVRHAFSAEAISAAAHKRYESARNKQGRAKSAFLSEIARSAPPGILIDINLIDIDKVQSQPGVRSSGSTIAYGQNVHIPMNEVCDEALKDYIRYRIDSQRFYRLYRLFGREEQDQKETFELTLRDVEDLRIFEVPA